MKKIIILIAIIMTASVAFAQYNAVVPATKTLQTKVIKPFIIHDYDGQAVIPHLPDVIKGEVLNISPTPSGDADGQAKGGVVKLFEMHKDANYNVGFSTMTCQSQSTVAGKGTLKITAHWYWHDTPPEITGDLSAWGWNGLGPFSGMGWINQQTIGWLTIHVTQINAQSVTGPATFTFTATITGAYNNL